MSVFPAEIVDMLVASLAEGYLTEEETRLVIKWACDRRTLGSDRAQFFNACMTEITSWPFTEGVSTASTVSTLSENDPPA